MLDSISFIRNIYYNFITFSATLSLESTLNHSVGLVNCCNQPIVFVKFMAHFV